MNIIINHDDCVGDGDICSGGRNEPLPLNVAARVSKFIGWVTPIFRNFTMGFVEYGEMHESSQNS